MTNLEIGLGLAALGLFVALLERALTSIVLLHSLDMANRRIENDRHVIDKLLLLEREGSQPTATTRPNGGTCGTHPLHGLHVDDPKQDGPQWKCPRCEQPAVPRTTSSRVCDACAQELLEG